MPDSWRNILERAAENLSIELDRTGPHHARQQPAGWPAPRKAALPPLPRGQNRGLLEPGLEALPKDLPVGQPRRDARRAASRPSKARRSARQARAVKSDKKGPLGEFAPAVISVAIVALTVYAIYNLLH
jgi:hypothetical protein